MQPIRACRSCGSEDLTVLFSLGEQYVSNFVDPGEELDGPKVPITIGLCRNCTLVQSLYSAPSDFLYRRFYWYRSGVTNTMRQALAEIAQEATNRASLVSGDIVLDIGSNDGTLLRSYAVQDLFTVGVEPARNLAEEGRKGVTVFIDDFWSYELYHRWVGRPAKVITAIGMFYDLEDPNQFIFDIARALDPNGLFIAQLMCLANMVELADVGNFAHEHLEYYSLASLRYLFARHGLEIMDIESNNVNGSSYRLYVRHIGSKVAPPPGAEMRLSEAELKERGLDDPEVYSRLFERMEANKQVCVQFIKDQVQAGRRVWVYGASTKGNVILQYYGLDKTLIQGAAERSPEKWGKVTVGTGIPIYSEEEFRRAQPDYALVLPYAFIEEFVIRESEWRSRGGRFLVPLPEFRVV